MITEFNKYAAKGNEVLNLISEDLHIPQKKAWRILRAVLHAIRNHLSVQGSLQVIAQLPVALKGIYVDQWNSAQRVPRIRHVSQFLDEVRKCDAGVAGYDFGNDERAEIVVKGVFGTLSNYLSEGEFEDIIAVMPAELKQFIRESIGQGKIVL